MNRTTMIARLSSWTDDRLPRTHRRLGVALLAGALISATSCGSGPASQAGSSATTTAPMPSASTTTSTTPTSTTSVVPATTTVATVARPTATIDQLVGTEGDRMHIRCVGEGDTTVVLIAGFGGDSTSWATVEPEIAARARVCSSDRPGTGTSDPATATATFSTQATDLHALLATVGEPGPYVVVGHSFGGAEAVTFASLFTDEVTGLVLVDSSPTTWPDALCTVADDGSDGAAMLRGLCTAAFPPSGNSERLDVVAAFADAAGIVSLGSLPTAVISASRRETPPDLAMSEVERLNEVWNQGQQDWLALSTDAHLVTVDDTGHNIQIDQPAVVIGEITGLLP
ncbi:MAG TPA: alpha/beta hydrolase [Ilumatobacteraceae bacterium]|nr:alpha/beta hydrolase [Ilumatobacteraceae bacterium]